jgi:hypothetical protein
VTNAQFQQFVDATGYVTDAEKDLDPRECPQGAPGNARRRRPPLSPGLRRESIPVRRGRSALVEVHRRSQLAAPRRPRFVDRRAHGPSRGLRHLQGRAGLRQVGRQAAAHGSRMGVRRTRRPQRQTLRLGRRRTSGRQDHEQPLAGQVPRARQRRRRLHLGGSGEIFSAQRLRALRRLRQRLGDVRGLVRPADITKSRPRTAPPDRPSATTRSRPASAST